MTDTKAGWTSRFKALRVAVLLVILAAVAIMRFGTQARLQSWRMSATAVVIPVLGDPRTETQAYATALQPALVAPVEQFIAQQAQQYRVALQTPVYVRLGHVVREIPPPPPKSNSVVDVMLWSLRLRWWAFRMERGQPSGSVRIFVVYQGGSTRLLDASYGLKESLIGVVNTAPSPQEEGWTQVAIVHEMLHTLGATDKYAPNGMPIFPQGYAEPARPPPADKAEIMAGQRPLSETTFAQARSLDECVVGPKTAQEIGWLKN